jgi:hypothetical protein
MRISVELVERLRAAKLVNAAERRIPVIDAGGQLISEGGQPTCVAARPVLQERDLLCIYTGFYHCDTLSRIYSKHRHVRRQMLVELLREINTGTHYKVLNNFFFSSYQ